MTRTRGETINTWLQSIGIVIAAFWALYTFVYDKFIVPDAAPVNTNLTVELHRGETVIRNPEDGPITAVSMTVSVVNPSPRIVKLFHSVWIADAMQMKTQDAFDGVQAANILNGDDVKFVERYALVKHFVLVGAGRLFGDLELEPSERVSHTEIFYVPAQNFDAIEVGVFLPSATDDKNLLLTWTLDSTNDGPQSLVPMLYLVDRPGAKPREVTQKESEKRNYAVAVQTSTLSLW